MTLDVKPQEEQVPETENSSEMDTDNQQTNNQNSNNENINTKENQRENFDNDLRREDVAESVVSKMRIGDRILSVGQQVDVLDSVQRWCEAEVTSILVPQLKYEYIIN